MEVMTIMMMIMMMMMMMMMVMMMMMYQYQNNDNDNINDERMMTIGKCKDDDKHYCSWDIQGSHKN